jgi:hypothetical protein
MNTITRIKEQVKRLKGKGVVTELKDATGETRYFAVKMDTPRFLRAYRRQLIALTHKQLDAQGIRRHKDGNKLGLRKRLEGEALS